MSTAEREDAFQRTRFWPSLDGLRAISIAAVVWHHAAGPRAGLAGQGFRGVDLFFAISGFLITTLLLREQARTGTVDLGGFYLRRALRIFPLYYASLAVYSLLVRTLEPNTFAGHEFMHNLPYFATYTSNWFIDLQGERVIFYFAWSLATEQQFYAVWPWVLRFSRKRDTPLFFMAALALVWLAARVGVSLGWLETARLPVRILLYISPAICLGSIAAILVHRPAGFRWLDLLLGRRWSLPLLFAAVIAALAVPASPDLLIAALMACVVVACCLRPDHPLKGALENRVVLHVGKVSYGIYLLHLLAINAVRRVTHLHYGWVVFSLGFLLAIAGASLSYQYFERRFLDLKDQLTRRAAAIAA